MAHAAMPKLSKLERKLQKKITKSQRTLLKHDGIETSDKATKVYCLTSFDSFDLDLDRVTVIHLSTLLHRASVK